MDNDYSYFLFSTFPAYFLLQICNTGDINKKKNYAEAMILIGNVNFDLIFNSLCAIQKGSWIVYYFNYFFQEHQVAVLHTQV